MNRILVRGNTWLGDAVMSLPTIAGLRAMFPSARVEVMTSPALAELYGDAAVTQPNGHDAAVILPRSFRSAWEMWRAGVPRRVGFAAFGRTWMLTDTVERDGATHRARAFFDLLRPFGTPPEMTPPTLDVPAAAREWAAERMAGDGWVALNPGAQYGAAKQWLPERFAELAGRIRRQMQKRVVVVGNQTVEADLDLTGRTSVMQLAAVLARAEFLVTNDTGPMHVADAVGTRVVAIFGPTDPVTTPPFRPQTIVRKSIECAPCLKRVCPLGHHRCMTAIEVDDVYHACL